MTARADPLRRFDAALERRHRALVLGLDEVGRGCLAGPVVSAAVVLRPDAETPGIDDSKRLTPAQRLEQWHVIRGAALVVAWSFMGPRRIDATDIRRSSLQSMSRSAQRALAILRRRPAAIEPPRLFAVVDGLDLVPGLPIPQEAFVAADGKSRAVAAASIVAKVARDRFMERLDVDYPSYGFARHKGYATLEHREALQRLGPCPWHRHTFRPVIEQFLPFLEPLVR